MTNAITISAVSVGAGGLTYATIKVLLAGLILHSVFYISSPTEVGVEVIGQYSDLNLAELISPYTDLNLTEFSLYIPVFGSIEDVQVDWRIYDADTGELINQDSFLIEKIEKDKPFIFNKKTKLNVPVNQVNNVKVFLTISGKINGLLPISKDETLVVSANKLAAGYNVEW